MMLTPFIRIQLTIFTIASVIGVTVMFFQYMQVPTLLGLGRITVTLELPATGGLYRFSNVTYRGVQIGKVTSVEPTAVGARATLSIATSAKIPAELHAEVRSVSAVGEQYVDLIPRSGGSPYLHDGSVITLHDTTIPQPVGPVLDRLSALVDSVPKDNLHRLLDESFEAFNGAGDDFSSLLGSAAELSHDANATGDRMRSLIDDSAPLLDSQAQTTDAIRLWARSLAGATEQLVADEPRLRTLLRTGPDFEQEVTRLLNEVKPTLPVLLGNLTTIGQIGVTYHPGLEQLLVLLPPYVAATSSYAPTNNPTGLAPGGFAISIADPPVCTVGFLPPSQWRSPADTSVIDTPDGLYCKLPQDSPIGVRGARNYPCMGHPGKRAPTVEICESDKPYEPLAMRQHALGPYPLDPNLLSQGIPPDDRVTFGEHEYGPVRGTPMIPGSLSPPVPPSEAPAPLPAPSDLRSPQALPNDGQGPRAAPGSFDNGDSDTKPSVAVAHYDPRTGRYVASDGRLYRQSDLVSSSGPKTWQEMLTLAG